MRAEGTDFDLPSDWQLARIGEKVTFTSRPRDLRFEDREFIPFVPMDRLPSDRLFFSDFILRTPQGISSGTYFEEGDLLVSKITPCFENGKQGIAVRIPGGFGIATTEVIPIKAIDGVSHLPFLAMYLLHPDVRNRLAGRMEGATGRQRLAKSVLVEWTMPFPPLVEQQAIAGVLAKIQGAVEVQERIVASLRELKAAVMARLFREGLRGEPLKQTEIGEIPESWKVVFLGELCAEPSGFIQTGPFGSQLHASDYVPDGIPIVNPTHIDENRIRHEGIPRVSKLDADRLQRHRLKVGDILFSRRGDVGRHAHVFEEEEGWLCGTGCLIVRAVTQRIFPLYLSYFLSTPFAQEYLRSHAVGSIMPNINTKVLVAVPVAVPSYDEQQEIAESSRAFDERIQREAKRKDVLSLLFSSMLHLLMTGRVRVTRKMIALQALANRAARRPKWSGKVAEKVLEEIVRRIVEAAAPEKIILFGTAARGEMGPDSDVDLLVVKSCENRREVARAIRRVLRGLGVPKDIVVVTPEDVEEQRDIPGMVVRAALREGRVLYAA